MNHFLYPLPKKSAGDSIDIYRDVSVAYRAHAKQLKPGSKHGQVSGRVYVARMVGGSWLNYPAIATVVNDIEETVNAMGVFQVLIDLLGPHARIGWHTDPYDSTNSPMRFHIPIVTNSKAVWADELNGEIHMQPGRVYGPVPYRDTPHMVANRGNTNRVHMVVDLWAL